MLKYFAQRAQEENEHQGSNLRESEWLGKHLF